MISAICSNFCFLMQLGIYFSASAFPVHPADPVGGNLLGTDRLAFEVAAAAAEALGLHLALHGFGAAGPFQLPLRQLPQVRQLGGHEQAGRGIAATGDQHRQPWLVMQGRGVVLELHRCDQRGQQTGQMNHQKQLQQQPAVSACH